MQSHQNGTFAATEPGTNKHARIATARRLHVRGDDLSAQAICRCLQSMRMKLCICPHLQMCSCDMAITYMQHGNEDAAAHGVLQGRYTCA